MTNWGILILALATGGDANRVDAEAFADRGQRQNASGSRPAQDGSLGKYPLVAIASDGPVYSTHVETGYAILNGRYLPPPYVIRSSNAGFSINDVALTWNELGFALKATKLKATKSSRTNGRSSDAQRPDSSGRRRNRPPRSGRQPFVPANAHASENRKQFNEVAQRELPALNSDLNDRVFKNANGESRQDVRNQIIRGLRAGLTVVHLAEEPILIASERSTSDAVLSHLVRYAPQLALEPRLSSWDELLPPDANTTVWRAWLDGFEPPGELLSRGTADMLQAEQKVSRALAKRSWLQRVDLATYPLSVAGMILAVVALGHLLRTVPNRSDLVDGVCSRSLMQATTIAILLIAALSSLDLTWTVLSAQAGTMRELNPLGAQLIDSPVVLTSFKVLATLLGCGLLYKLRWHQRAADASWWMCLVMTVVTLRWVMFNSMFA